MSVSFSPTTDISFNDILDMQSVPTVKRVEGIGRKKRPVAHSTVLTESPYKNDLQFAKVTKEGLKGGSTAKRVADKQLTKKSAKRKIDVGSAKEKPTAKKTQQDMTKPNSSNFPPAPKARGSLVRNNLSQPCSSKKSSIMNTPSIVNYYCGGCGELYDDSKIDWLRCTECREWWEMDCAWMLGKSKETQDRFRCNDCDL